MWPLRPRGGAVVNSLSGSFHSYKSGRGFNAFQCGRGFNAATHRNSKVPPTLRDTEVAPALSKILFELSGIQLNTRDCRTRIEAGLQTGPREGTGLTASYEGQITGVWGKALIQKREQGMARQWGR